MLRKTSLVTGVCGLFLLSAHRCMALDDFWHVVASLLRASATVADTLNVDAADRAYVECQYRRFDCMIDAIGYDTVHTISSYNVSRLERYIEQEAAKHLEFSFPVSFIVEELGRVITTLNLMQARHYHWSRWSPGRE